MWNEGLGNLTPTGQIEGKSSRWKNRVTEMCKWVTERVLG